MHNLNLFDFISKITMPICDPFYNWLSDIPLARVIAVSLCFLFTALIIFYKKIVRGDKSKDVTVSFAIMIALILLGALSLWWKLRSDQCYPKVNHPFTSQTALLTRGGGLFLGLPFKS